MFLVALIGFVVCMLGIAITPWDWRRRWWVLAYAVFIVVLLVSKTPAS